MFKFLINETDEYYVDTINEFYWAVSVDAIGGLGSAIHNYAKVGCNGHGKGWCQPELRIQGGGGYQTTCNVIHSS